MKMNWKLGLAILTAILTAIASHALALPAALVPYHAWFEFAASIVAIVLAALTDPKSLSGQPPSVAPRDFGKPAAMILLALALPMLMLTACAKKAPATSPVVLSAVKATEVVHALDVVRDVAVTLNAQQPPVISTKTLQTVLAAHRSIVSVIGAAPNGWKATAAAALVQLQKDLPAADAQRLAPYLALVQTLVEAFVPAGLDAAVPWTVKASLAADDGRR